MIVSTYENCMVSLLKDALKALPTVDFVSEGIQIDTYELSESINCIFQTISALRLRFASNTKYSML